MARSLVGMRIREQRRALKMRQADLARRVGISPSYMNLIERNKRGIAGGLLRRIGEELGLSIEVLTGTAEQRLETDLIDLARDPERGDPAMDPATAGEFIGRFPGWARALARMGRRERAARAEAAALSDRLTHDPFLSQAVHAMLTDIAALRSTAGILTDVPDIDRQDRDRFQGNISALAERLAETGSALARYFDETDTPADRQSDIDMLEDFISTGDSHFEFAEKLGAQLAADIAAKTASEVPGDAFLQSSTRRRWARARAYIRKLHLPELQIPVTGPESPSDPAAPYHPSITGLLMDRAADAALAPVDDFLARLDKANWDLPTLCRAYDGEIGLVFRRLLALPGHRFGYLRTDASGRTRTRLGALDQLPRHYDAACPLWAIHRARIKPFQPIFQRVRFPEGIERIFIAMADPDTAEAHQISADPANMPGEFLSRVVNSDRPRPVGATCQLCAHADCAQRREPPVVDLAVSSLQTV